MAFPVGHLARRFFGAVGARPLAPHEQDEVARLLAPALADLFWRQAPVDQRHAYDVMRRAAGRTADPDVLAAALVHDVGKAGTPTNPIVRSFATVFDSLHIPLKGGMAEYRRHGERGAELLGAAGGSVLTVDFARRHPDPDPTPHDPASWAILLNSDDI